MSRGVFKAAIPNNSTLLGRAPLQQFRACIRDATFAVGARYIAPAKGKPVHLITPLATRAGSKPARRDLGNEGTKQAIEIGFERATGSVVIFAEADVVKWVSAEACVEKKEETKEEERDRLGGKHTWDSCID